MPCAPSSVLALVPLLALVAVTQQQQRHSSTATFGFGFLTPSSPPSSSPWSMPWALGRSLAAHLGVRTAGTDSSAGPASSSMPAPEPIEATLNATELIQHWGYPAETHTIQTADGYVLTLQRIPWGRYGPSAASSSSARPPILLQHGLLQTADQWLLRGADQDLAFILADLGYDVWLGNFRGNVYCRRHATLSPDSERFWRFSWHENGVYDLSATIDYVLAVTGQPSLSYVGHSMGTTALFVLLSERPEYNASIRFASLMAPVAYFSQLRGVLTFALPLFKRLDRDLKRVSHEMLPLGSFPRSLVTTYCRPDSPVFNACVGAYFQVAGPSPKQLIPSLFPIILSHIPAGSSLGQFTHYAQTYKSGQFRKFDYGIRWNTLHYGQSQAPLYNLSNIVAPLHFHYSTGDYLAHPKDVERLISQIPGTAGVYKIPAKDFNHGDYMWAKDTYELLYKTVVKLLRDS